MKQTCLILTLISSGFSHADTFVSNFNSVGSELATGVWRNETAGSNLATPVSISIDGFTAEIRGANEDNGSLPIDNPSIIDNSFPWQPVVGGANPFDPNFNGDFINIDSAEALGLEDEALVTIDLGESVTDPVVSFFGIQSRTTVTFDQAFSVVSSTSNLAVAGTSLSSDGTSATNDTNNVFGIEASGSIQFIGTFSELTFSIFVDFDESATEGSDRIGFVVSYEKAIPPPPLLSITQTGTQVTLNWVLGEFDEIQISGLGLGLSGWTAIPGLDPSATNTWTGDLSSLGTERFFRGEYTP